MSKDFENIMIVDLDVDMTRHSNKASGLRHMFLRLSSRPPTDWVRIFDNERGFPRHTMWRKAWVEGQHIVVDCVPEEIERYHLRDLKEDVANANRKYREYIVQVQAEKERDRSAEAAEKERLRNLKGNLKFD